MVPCPVTPETSVESPESADCFGFSKIVASGSEPRAHALRGRAGCRGRRLFPECRVPSRPRAAEDSRLPRRTQRPCHRAQCAPASDNACRRDRGPPRLRADVRERCRKGTSFRIPAKSVARFALKFFFAAAEFTQPVESDLTEFAA